jgi:hypothetical protein
MSLSPAGVIPTREAGPKTALKPARKQPCRSPEISRAAAKRGLISGQYQLFKTVPI